MNPIDTKQKSDKKKITIIGSHGTGKTTLANALSSKLRYPVIPDTVIEGVQRGLEADEKTSSENQLWFFLKNLEYQQKFGSTYISDKATWDFYVYAQILIKDQAIISVIHDLALKHGHYDLVLYLPIEFQIENNGLRSLDQDFQKRIDKEYRRFLKENNIQFFELHGSLDDRVNQALNLIKETTPTLGK